MVFIYIIRCVDNTFYTGITNNLEKRFLAHTKGLASYTKKRLPFHVEHIEYRFTRSAAAKQERKIKNIGAWKYCLRFVRDTTFPLISLDRNLLLKYSANPKLFSTFVAAR